MLKGLLYSSEYYACVPQHLFFIHSQKEKLALPKVFCVANKHLCFFYEPLHHKNHTGQWQTAQRRGRQQLLRSWF